LSSLQKAASAKFGMSAQQVLDTAQSLYEKKLTSYPRTDCRYLPAEQFDAAGKILDMLKSIPGLEQAAGNADPSVKSGAWDTKKITAHHAIIPTGEKPGALTAAEQDVYQMIALAYCLQFYPIMRYEAQKIALTLGDMKWEAKGRLILEPGWTRAAVEEEDDSDKEKADDQSLPAVNQGDAVTCRGVETLKKKTSPPPRFTEGTLIEAMANVHRFVTDADAKAVLKENEGIGTEATRAGILETLKSRGYLAVDKKALVSTPLGRDLIELTPEPLKDPATTAQWESKLEAIAKGNCTLDSFMADQARVLPALLSSILDRPPDAKNPVCYCPACGKPMLRRKGNGKNGKAYDFWGCSNYPACMVKLDDDHGKPGKEVKPSRELSTFTCPKCGKLLYYQSSVSKKTGKPYELFSCSGYPECKESFFGRDGKPDF
jgi:DNA topoisomerase-3